MPLMGGKDWSPRAEFTDGIVEHVITEDLHPEYKGAHEMKDEDDNTDIHRPGCLL